ncbi:MAG: NYN domain-containing protein [Chloroflexi bacterium]|nr:NYN domain-containing protein [Chloroflexota bacterium]
MPTRVIVFIDGSNLYHSLKQDIGRTDLDFARFSSKLADGRELVRSYYYNAPLDQTKEPQRYRDQEKFFERLRRTDYLELRFGKLVYRGWPKEPPYEKGIDVKLTTDLLVHGFRNNYDVAILVSGDTDFADALQAVKDVGKHVEVALFRLKTSRHLRDMADKVIRIDGGFLSDCWI